MSKRNGKLPDGMIQRGAVYWADFRAGGRRIRKSLSRNLKTAKQLLIELRARAERGDYGLLDNDCPVEELRTQYLRHCRQALKPATVERYEQRLDRVLAALPGRTALFTVDGVLTYRDHRLAEGGSPRTINQEVTTLTGMLNWAVSPARLISENPLRGIKALPHDHPKEGRPLTTDEVGRLLKASHPHWRDVWYAFLVTGVRAGELFALRFDDILWDSRELHVRRNIAKNHKARFVPIDNGLWKILERLADERPLRKPYSGQSEAFGRRLVELFTRDHVFTTRQCTPLSRAGVYKAFVRTCRRAGIQVQTMGPDGYEVDHVDVHSLRRTFATELIVNGADPKSVQELLGHATLAMTMNIYAKVHTGTKRQAVGRLPYGEGVEAPEHAIELPTESKSGHKMSTVGKNVIREAV